MTENAAFGHLGNVPLQDVEVGATDGRAVDPHDGIGVVLDRRHGNFLPVFASRSVVDEGLHDVLRSLGAMVVDAQLA